MLKVYPPEACAGFITDVKTVSNGGTDLTSVIFNIRNDILNVSTSVPKLRNIVSILTQTVPKLIYAVARFIKGIVKPKRGITEPGNGVPRGFIGLQHVGMDVSTKQTKLTRFSLRVVDR